MFNRKNEERDLDRELRGWVEMLTDEKIRAGVAPHEARRQALAETGGVERVKDEVRDVRRGAALETFLQDLRYAARSLRHAPGFAIAAVLTLAIGIGANTAIFTAVDALLFKPLPFSHPEQIVTLFQNDTKKGLDRDDVAPGNFAEWHARTTTFAGMAVAEPNGFVFSGPEGEERLGSWNVTQDFFGILDAKPQLGRLLQPDDFQPGKGLVLVLTWDAWQRRFAADPHVVGQTLRGRRGPAVVVGVLPRNFSYLANQSRYEAYMPKVLDSSEVVLRSAAWYHAVARLKPGVTPVQAAADLNRVATQLEREYPRTNTGIRITQLPLREGIVGNAAQLLLMLLGAVGFVLLIACTNVANLMLARTARRSREFAVRVALGAGPRRIARQVLTESFLIALAGGVAGALLAQTGVVAIRLLAPASLPRVGEMHVDGRALAFAMVVVIAATFVFGLLPALRAAGPGTGEELKSGSRSAGSRVQRRVRGLLVSTEVALAVVLLVGAGLLMRSFVYVTTLDPGYRSDHVLTGTVFIWAWNPTASSRRVFIEQMVADAAAIPGVESAGATTSLPLQGAIGADHGPFTIAGEPVAPGEEPSAHITSLTPGALAVLGMKLKRGRLLNSHDDSSGARVAVVSEAMARRYFGGADPVGKRIRLGFYGPPVEREIVGMVQDIRQSALDAPPDPTVYLPYAQDPTGGVTVVVRTRGEPRSVARPLKAVITALNPQIPVTETITLDELVANSLKARRFTLVLFGCFAVAALLLAVIGVYGVMSNATAERTREFGVRIALGASAGEIVRMVLGQGLGATVAGLVAGIAGAAALTTTLNGMLFGVTQFDAVTFAGVAMLMLTTAVVACYIPARRATRVEPVVVLRA